MAFSGSFSGNRFSLPISALFLARVDYHSYSALSRLLGKGGRGFSLDASFGLLATASTSALALFLGSAPSSCGVSCMI